MSAQLAASEKRTLVTAAEKILDAVKSRDHFKDQTSQLRNLVQIAQEESEVPVLRNFIRYQTGRKATGKFWLLIHQGVVQELERIETSHQEEAVRKLAIQSFFGYLVRHYVYLNKMAGGH
jgi:hypothetical protein